MGGVVDAQIPNFSQHFKDFFVHIDINVEVQSLFLTLSSLKETSLKIRVAAALELLIVSHDFLTWKCWDKMKQHIAYIILTVLVDISCSEVTAHISI